MKYLLILQISGRCSKLSVNDTKVCCIRKIKETCDLDELHFRLSQKRSSNKLRNLSPSVDVLLNSYFLVVITLGAHGETTYISVPIHHLNFG